MNLILQTDSYKVSHWKQYPPGTEKVYSYFESRGGKFGKIVFFGLQYILKKYLTGSVVTMQDVDQAEKLFKSHFGSEIFNREGWEYIVNELGGKLPIEIKAVAEGSLNDQSQVLFTVENTDPKCYWLTNYLETLLEQVWYPCTVATKSHDMKMQLKLYLSLTGDDPSDFKLHDFGYRGSTSQESAGIGGAAHLINFKGSDTLAAITTLQDYYHADMPAFSIPAAEHSTITSWGRSNELKAYQNIIEQFPLGLIAVVSDSYNIYEACEKMWGGELKDKVVGRNGTIVIRPDSGDPQKVLPMVLEILGKSFGKKLNSKGFYVLPSYIRVIWGDGIDSDNLTDILTAVVRAQWSIDNIAFGSGGGLLQKLNRDTLRFAYKCSNVTINGVDVPVFKDPITDSRKGSKQGRFHDEGLKTIFKNGELLVDQTLHDIRERVSVV